MAYVFGQINDALNNSGGQNSGSNIFSGNGQQAADPNASVSAQQGQGESTGSSPMTLSDSSGTVGKQGTTSPSGTSAQSASNNLAQTLPFNNQPVGNLGFVKDAQDSVAPLQKGLQDQADSLATEANKTPMGDLDEGTLDKAISGDGVAKTTVSNHFQNKPEPVKPIDLSGANTTINNLGKMSSDAGRQELFQAAGGENYTQGMGAYDNLALRNDPQFGKIMADLSRTQSGLVQTRDNIQNSTNDEILATRGKNYEANNDFAKKYLAGKLTGLNSAVDQSTVAGTQGARSTYGTALSQAETAGSKAISDEISNLSTLSNDPDLSPAARSNVLERISTLSKLLNGNAWEHPGTVPGSFGPSVNFGFTPSEFATPGRSTFITPEQAMQFNIIHALLGDGQTVTAGSPYAAPKLYDPNQMSTQLRSMLDPTITAARKDIADNIAKKPIAAQVAANPVLGPVAAPIQVNTHPEDYVPDEFKPVARAGSKVLEGINTVRGWFSDERTKTDVADGHGEARAFLESVAPKTYEYKSAEFGAPGRHLSPMAQDLEKTEAGRQAVSVDPRTGMKMVDYGALFPSIVASLGHLNERLKKAGV